MAYQRLGSMSISWTVYNNDNLYIITEKPQKFGAFLYSYAKIAERNEKIYG